MANSLISFTPEDFDTVLTRDELIEDISSIIKEIRMNNNGIYTDLIDQISSLHKLRDITSKSSISELLQAYKTLQSISIQLRKLLSHFIKDIDIYDNIAYAFYYNNERYSTEEVDIKWLRKGSEGQLILNLENATKDIKQSLTDNFAINIQELLKKHYLKYFEAIAGMYKMQTKYPIGARVKGAKLNEGHVTEAYESHLASHHSGSYQLINQFTSGYFTIDKIMAAQSLEEEFKTTYWAEHESPDNAWIHIRGALGTQRGTVAGDVGRYQVKRGTNKNQYSKEVRLTSLTNLQRGISNYSDLINPQISAEEVAKKVAVYLSEPVARNERNIQSYIANKQDLGKYLDEFLNNSKKYLIHI